MPRRSATWLEVFVDGESRYRLPAAHAPSGLSEGALLSDETSAMLGELSDYHQLKDSALRMLARREHFAQELDRKLRQRTLDRGLIARVREECRANGFLDDARAAESLAEGLLARRSMGLGRLKSELFRRGCPAELSQAVLDKYREHFETPEALSAAVDVARRRFATRVAREIARCARTAAAGADQSEADDEPAALRLRQREEQAQLRRSRQRIAQQLITFLSARGFGGEAARRAAWELLAELFAGAEPDPG